MSYLVNHSSRYVDYIVNFPADDNNLTGSFIAEADGEIYDIVNKTNIASFTLSGVVPVLPASVTSQITYPVSIIKTTAGQTASITFRIRRAVNKTITTNVATTLAESEQGTHCFFIHSSDNKLTIIDNSLINSSNYVSENTWITDPKTVVSLPTASGVIWDSCIEDKVNDRLLIVGRNTNNTASFLITTMPLSGAKKFQIWNCDQTNQNTYNTYSSTALSSQIYPMIDYNNNIIIINQGYTSYKSYLSLSLNFSLNTNGNLLTHQGGGPIDQNMRKPSYKFDTGYFICHTCAQKYTTPFTKIGNWADGYAGQTIDNITGYIYKYSAGVGAITIYSDTIKIGQITVPNYNPRLWLAASVKRRLLFAQQTQYTTITHQYNISLINLSTNTHIRTEAVFTDTNVTGCKDGDYCNAIDMFCLLSDGTAATSGRRMVYYCSSDYDGTNPLLKYKVLLDYDSTFMCTNRLRY